jgi:hypothetical protein
MNPYTVYAISCYIIMRGFQVLLEEHNQKKWYKNLIGVWTVFTLYSAVASLIVFYFEELNLLGFPADG